jgi:protein-tyrosine phosphatase
MARPGFNSYRWFDLPFEEAVLMGWIGQFSSSTQSLAAFRKHVRTYGAKIYPFHKVDKSAFEKSVLGFDSDSEIIRVLERINARTNVLENYQIKGDEISFELSHTRMNYEIDCLKKQGIETIVTLTERHHGKDALENHFELHHLSIEDLNAPRVEQAGQLAEIIRTSQKTNKKLAVHCLAGIGRTSTMLMAAHILMGDSFESVKQIVAKKNPKFILTGPQADFVHAVAHRVNA